MNIKIPELLAPAGNYEKLITAIHYGADAVYLAGREFGLRAKAGNFSDEGIAEGVKYAHKKGVQVFVTVNIFAHNRDFAALPAYLKHLQKCGVDAVIVADPGVLRCLQQETPTLPVHLSTQANVTNGESAQFWLSQGAGRLNLAREISLSEIAEIRSATQGLGELEVFVHGALCISYSGRCLLSNYFTGRDANRGACAHPCRFRYALVEEKREGEYFPIDEDERGTYIFNSKDLCLLEKLPLLVAAGVDSLKIEGRMKSIFYVGGVVRVYRAALDYLAGLSASAWQRPEDIVLPEYLFDEIARLGTRGMTENFFSQKPASSEMIYHSSRLEQSWEPVAVVREASSMESGRILVDVRNTVFAGEELEYMGKDFSEKRQFFRLSALFSEGGEKVDKGNPGNRLFFEFDSLFQCGRHGIFRRRKS